MLTVTHFSADMSDNTPCTWRRCARVASAFLADRVDESLDPLVAGLPGGCPGLWYMPSRCVQERPGLDQRLEQPQAINPDVYRGPWGGANCRDSIAQTQRSCQCAQGECEAAQQYVRQLEDVLAHSAPKAGVAAFIAEYIQGVGGSVHLPRGYLKQAYEAIRAKGGVCIMDEVSLITLVQTGFGRLGSTTGPLKTATWSQTLVDVQDMLYCSWQAKLTHLQCVICP
ncbi:Alanine--glyoxylate aminotransferase 2, mitochondrial [Geodia barretti]|uniref:Alanine--glyoxylate aminotransferase 2, mitochondrial n=1 Tax=Geodia barretti TaxID=519541 RepID=A0AA35RBR7_GEOBA|nr:Alanine--glyoxylate aminotransferase 2, mitochondrial [Geodia barretti]